MKTLTKWLAASFGMAVLLFFFACNKNNSAGSNPNIPPGKSKVSIYMMDDPVQLSKVLIDIRQVAVEVDTAVRQTDSDRDDQWDDNYWGWHRDHDHKSVIWDTLSITPGVYDLLQLRNGADTLLASGLVTNGKVLKIRITLGSDNTVFTDSTTSYPLEVFGPNPYFTINVARTNVSEVTNNEFKMWLDFNLGRSIFFWNGTFLLKPYFTVFNDHVMAKIQGRILPQGASPLVTAYNAGDTLYAIPNYGGNYLFRGVPAGTYSINFKGHNGYKDTTINNIVVDSMKVVQIPTITLHK
ncbi:MAG: DUF4382 domain-containing protein [Bacteroidota bacterium]|nr:DUF4382 domain-containing protein [Bacteroidota bacterium]MDP4254304.1 DUF4382 domain-containing protein [Bacteroidota bacterium]MDP4257611.1 DUF4382 domain-containing protein [Bacteroidota bacterium]